jgi:phenylacetate-CoA ligase
MLGRAAFRLTERLRRSATMVELARMEHEPSLAPEVVRERQLDRVRRLLRHAERHVPYYRELFRAHGIASDDIRSMTDLTRIPILTKSIVRERADDLIADNVDRATLVRHNSGGSTGAPLTFYHDASSLAASEAGVLRGFQQAGWQPGDMVAFFWGWDKRTNAMGRAEFEIRQWLRRRYQFDSFNASPARMAEWVEVWHRIRPEIVFGYASAIARFAEYLEQRAIALPAVKGVFTTAEKLYPTQRAQMGRVFRAPVFDCYGSSEVRNIATQCAVGRMHVNADFVVVETDESTIDPSDPTAPAPFLVTSLRSYGMPFIRYRNEDCGRLLPGICDCGSGFPLMDLQIARVTDHVLLPGGRVVHGLFLIHRLYGTRGIANFQFHQTALDRITLLVVPSDDDQAGRAEVTARIAGEIRALSDHPIQVDVREVDAIPLSAAGKHRYIRSDVTEANGSGATG